VVLWREEGLYSLRVLGGIYDQKQHDVALPNPATPKPAYSADAF
jgi:hypothetical protein